MNTTYCIKPVPDLTGLVGRMERHYFAHGENSNIWMGQWCDDSGTNLKVAVKVLNATHDGAMRNNRLLREIRVRAAVNHPNISPFFGVSLDFDRPLIPCLVSPYYQLGDIPRYLVEHPSVDKLALIVQIANAVSYLHDAGVVHGNIRASNILINDKREAVLSNVGLAHILRTSCYTAETPGKRNYISPDLFPPCEGEIYMPATTTAWRWRAPELIGTCVDGQGDSICRVTTATDVYAFAMTVIEVFTGHAPFSHIKNDAKVVITAVEGGRPKRKLCPQITDDIWKILEMCWDAESAQRPSMDTVFRFFKLQSSSLARL